MARDLDAWKLHVEGLPHEPWDIYTDFPRDAARWRETLGTSVVKDVVMDSVPLAADGEKAVRRARCDEHSILAAVAAALGTSDHGRTAIWVLDQARLPGADLPVRVTLEGSLDDVRKRIQWERDLVASLWTAAASESGGGREAAAALLRERAARKESTAQPVGAACQLSLQRGPRWEASPARSPPPDLCVLLHGRSESEGGAEGISLAYRGDLFRAESARAIAAHASALLQTSQPWGSLQVEALGRVLVGEEEAARLSDAWQGERAPFERDSCIHSLFERVARGEAADRVALIPFDEAEAPWSYAQLDMAAGLVARALLSLCVEPGGRSPLLIRRSCLLVAAIYGTLRAGQAYVPLDPDWPADRQCVVIEDVEASAVVLGEGLELPGQRQLLPVVKLSPSPPGARAECPLTATIHAAPPGMRQDLLPREAAAHATADMTVYVLYTSGTTGKPKGVNVPHRGLVGRTQWLQRTWPLSPEAVVAQKTPATFAISEWELFWPLCFGAKLSLAADGLHGDPQHVVRLLKDHAVTHTVFVPSLLEQLLDELNGEDLPALRLIIACGEALKASTALASLRGLPGTELVNLYGPTEGSMTMLRLPPSPSVEHLFRCPIGAPIDNTLVLCATGGDGQDSVAAMELAPVMSKGELLFGGPLIALGYWRRPELTREKFVDNPFGPGKAYRTGDLGRWRADGTLEFLGRADSQVKFNGVRIELSELEGALAALPGVRSAAAFLVPPHHLVIACALVATPAAVRSAGNASLENGGAPDSALQVDEREERRLWEGLRAVLPKDRLPTRLEILPSLPVTERGKVDRRKLVDGFQQREAQRGAARAPPAVKGNGPACGKRSPTEVLIEELMREVLDVTEPLSLTVSFQALGFSSLLLGKLTTRIRRAVCLPGLPATAVYKHPCAQDLAELIDQMREEQAASTFKNVQAGGPQVFQGELVPAQRVWGGRSSTSAFGWVCTIATMSFDCVVTGFSFLPAYYIFLEVYSRYGMWLVCLSSGFILLMDMAVTLLLVALLKWLIIGQCQEGVYPVFSSYYWKWRLMHTIESFALEQMGAYFTDTAAYNVLLRLYGAEIGPGARVNFATISEMDLVSIGENARVERDATLCPARIWNGELHLRRISVGAGSLVAHRSYMAGGTSLPPSMELTAMSSSDTLGPYHVKPRGRTFSSDVLRAAEEPGLDQRTALSWLQLFVGIPVILAAETLAEVPVFFALEGLWSALADNLSMPVDTGGFQRQEEHLDVWGWSWVTGQSRGFTLEDKRRVIYPFVALTPWITAFVHGGAYFLLVVCTKRFLVGKFKEGQVMTSWGCFRHWLIERLTTTPTFGKFMELWVNTEMLSTCYRLLGAHVAPRVNMDFFGAVEYDLVHIETDVVFGSSVLLVNTSGGVTRSVALRKGACVLDHSCVLPGAVVPEGALLGSFTVVPTGQQLEPMTVYTGNEQGACVRLFQRPLLPGERTEGERVVTETEPVLAGQGKDQALALPPAARRQRALEAEALIHHWSGRFYLFNAWCAASAVVFAPLPELVFWAAIVIDFEVYDCFGNSDGGLAVAMLLLGPLYIVVNLAVLAVICALKWTLIGRWQAGDRPYYTWFHFRWAALMVAFASLDDLLRSIDGTWLAVLFMRCMGATVGQRVCFFGHGFEFDLLHIGDEVCIGPGCDVTAHTVENMVMRMEQVRFESGSSCLGGSVVMPGGVMEEGSTLIEHSQVLKGEAVPEGAFFGGLPAKLLSSYNGLAPALVPLRDIRGWRDAFDDETCIALLP